MLISCICVCVWNEKYSHRATGSVRKGLDILPHSFLSSSKLRYALPWQCRQCMSRDRLAFGQITLHIYTHTYILLELPRSARGQSPTFYRLEFRVRISVIPCGFRGGDRVRFPRGFSRFPLPQISFHYFSTVISFISFRFISSAFVMVRHDWATNILAITDVQQTYRAFIVSHSSTRPCIRHESRGKFD